MDLLLIYLLIINAVGFFSMLLDKLLAKKKIWRMMESTLLTIAFLGGSIGTLLGMYLFRHKTRHLRFVVGVPLILAFHVILFIWLLLL